MKRINKVFRNLTAITVIGFFAFSCLNDTYNDFSKVAPTAEMIGITPGSAIAFTLSKSKDTTIVVKVNVTGPNAPSHDVTLTLGTSQAAIDLYNIDTSHVAGTMLPDTAYTIPATVTIKAGLDSLGNQNRSAEFVVTLHQSKVVATPGINYVLPIAITGAPAGYIVSSNQGAILYNFYHNPWDGPYNSTGHRYNYTLATDYTGWNTGADAPNTPATAGVSPWSFVTNAITVNAHNTLVHEGNDPSAFGFINVKVNNDFNGTFSTVAISTTCAPNDGSCAAPLTAVANLYPLPGVTSTYTPGTKTFDLYYQYTNPTGTFRVLHDVMVHQ